MKSMFSIFATNTAIFHGLAPVVLNGKKAAKKYRVKVNFVKDRFEAKIYDPDKVLPYKIDMGNNCLGFIENFQSDIEWTVVSNANHLAVWKLFPQYNESELKAQYYEFENVLRELGAKIAENVKQAGNTNFSLERVEVLMRKSITNYKLYFKDFGKIKPINASVCISWIPGSETGFEFQVYLGSSNFLYQYTTNKSFFHCLKEATFEVFEQAGYHPQIR